MAPLYTKPQCKTEAFLVYPSFMFAGKVLYWEHLEPTNTTLKLFRTVRKKNIILSANIIMWKKKVFFREVVSLVWTKKKRQHIIGMERKKN
jgi:hypothetical protein